MAALDFGMALARGMLPTAKKAQEDLLDLAGGRNVFKSEDWWNEQVDKQISKGYREAEKGTEYQTKSGQYVLGKRTVNSGYSGHPLYGPFNSGPSVSYSAPEDAVITGYTNPSYQYGGLFGMMTRSPIYKSRQVDVYGDFSKRKDYTAGELADIEKGAKRGAEQVKRKTAEQSASRKRLSRATGGLVGKATAPGAAPATGLPALGTTGFGIDEKTLGKGLLV